MNIKLLHGDCLDRLKELPDNSVDSIVTDPPAGIAFMGKEWDRDKGGRDSWIAWMQQIAAECNRVLKHGGHAFVWAIPRTSHWTATAWENAGFEIRDVVAYMSSKDEMFAALYESLSDEQRKVMEVLFDESCTAHVFGSGFPKSHNVGIAVDKLQGNEREDLGENPYNKLRGSGTSELGKLLNPMQGKSNITKGTSEFEGWGTALKPAREDWLLMRKPLEKGLTVAENCLKWGTGGINVDASRVESESGRSTGLKKDGTRSQNKAVYGDFNPDTIIGSQETNLGRFPANLILGADADGRVSEEVRECFPETKSGSGVKKKASGTADGIFNINKIDGEYLNGDSGNASRFFKSIIYQPKASKADRGKGNIHSTVKPTALMQYLITMVTPKGGTVLDPFMGSGTTGVAAVRDGFAFIGIEREAEYFEICKRRIEGAEPNETERGPLDQPHKQLTLF